MKRIIGGQSASEVLVEMGIGMAFLCQLQVVFPHKWRARWRWNLDTTTNV